MIYCGKSICEKPLRLSFDGIARHFRLLMISSSNRNEIRNYWIHAVSEVSLRCKLEFCLYFISLFIEIIKLSPAHGENLMFRKRKLKERFLFLSHARCMHNVHFVHVHFIWKIIVFNIVCFLIKYWVLTHYCFSIPFPCPVT